MTANWLTDEKLEKGLQVLLDRMEARGQLPAGCDKQAVLQTMVKALKEAFRDGITDEIFKGPHAEAKLGMLAINAHFEKTLANHPTLKFVPTAKLAKALLDENMSLVERRAILGQYLANTLKMFPQAKFSAREFEQMLDVLVAKIVNPEISVEPLLRGLSQAQLFMLDMLGVAGEGFSPPIQFNPGNAVGASDTAVLTGSGTAGLFYAQDNPAASNLNPAIKETLRARLDAVGDTTTGFEDALRQERVLHTSPQPPSPYQTTGGGH